MPDPDGEAADRIRTAATLLELDVGAFTAAAADDWARTVIAEYAEAPPSDQERRSTIAALRMVKDGE